MQASSLDLDLHVTPSADSHFAWVRTRLAGDRTFMAWLRTAASFIGFGFTIFEFFSRLDTSPGKLRAAQQSAVLGLVLIAAGVTALAIALMQYTHGMHNLGDRRFVAIADPHPPRSPAVFLAAVLIVVGIIAFASIVVRAYVMR